MAKGPRTREWQVREGVPGVDAAPGRTRRLGCCDQRILGRIVNCLPPASCYRPRASGKYTRNAPVSLVPAVVAGP
jgi:hypothetical protein